MPARSRWCRAPGRRRLCVVTGRVARWWGRQRRRRAEPHALHQPHARDDQRLDATRRWSRSSAATVSYLFFNSSNAPDVDTNLQVRRARRRSDVRLRRPARRRQLDRRSTRVASEDDSGDFYFITHAQLRGGLVDALPRRVAPARCRQRAPPSDAACRRRRRATSSSTPAVSPDGATLVFAEGDYSTGKLTTAALGLAARGSDGDFARPPTSDATLAAVNARRHDAVRAVSVGVAARALLHAHRRRHPGHLRRHAADTHRAARAAQARRHHRAPKRPRLARRARALLPPARRPLSPSTRLTR